MLGIKARPYLIALTLASCSVFSQSPERVYERFHSACEAADTATAEALVTPQALLQNQDYGVCILTHDGMNRVLGATAFTFDPEGYVSIVTGNTAYMLWQVTNARKYITVELHLVDAEWKIHRTLITDGDLPPH